LTRLEPQLILFVMGVCARALTWVLLVTSVAAAEPPKDRKKKASELWELGKAAEKGGDFAKACAKFREGAATDPEAFGILLNVADCDERDGHPLAAFKHFEDAAKGFEAANDERSKYARERMAAVTTKIPVLLIRMPDLPPGTIVKIGDDKPPVAREIRTQLDPGAVDVLVTAPGRKTFEDRATLVAGATAKITVTLDPVEREKPPLIVTERSPRRVRLALWTAVGGGAALVTSAVLGLVANHDYNAAAHGPECTQTPFACTPGGLSKISHARNIAAVATGFGIASALALGAAGVLYYTAPRERVMVAPAVSPNAVGLVVEHSF
jgi:hypothetical protein